MTPALRLQFALVTPTALLGLGACRSLAGNELGLTGFAAASPGWGGGLALEQRLSALAAGDLLFELGAERQVLEEEGPRGDDFTRAFSGLRLAPPPGHGGPQASLGVSWIRSEGEVSALDSPGDYGGAHLGLGWSFPLGLRMATGPEVIVSYLDAEGSRGGSGALLELTWRFVFRP